MADIEEEKNDIEEENEDSPMIIENKGDILKLLNERKEANTTILEKLAKLLCIFAVLLFVSLTITCIAVRWDLDAISVLIGYWLAFFMFSTGYILKKSIKRFDWMIK